jgi:hypothetical protein
MAACSGAGRGPEAQEIGKSLTRIQSRRGRQWHDPHHRVLENLRSKVKRWNAERFGDGEYED